MADEAVAGEPLPAGAILPAAPSRRRRAELIRYLIGIAVGAGVLVLLAGRRGELAAAWHQLSRVDGGWVAGAVAAETGSLLGYALLQHRVLRAAGAVVRVRALFLLTLANDAIACSVPGEPAVSSAYRYRWYRRRGASPAAAGWAIFTILIAQAIGMSLVLLAGVLVALAGPGGARQARAAVAGLVIIAAAGAILVRRDLVLRLAGAASRSVPRLLARVTGRPARGSRVEQALERMRLVPLGMRAAAAMVAMATAVWCCDFLCLICAFGAVRAPVPWSDVLLAYGVAQVVGSLPVAPGGLGLVEGSLAVILAAYGTGRVPALAAALVFRMVSYWMAIAAGWLAAGAIAARARCPAAGASQVLDRPPPR